MYFLIFLFIWFNQHNLILNFNVIVCMTRVFQVFSMKMITRPSHSSPLVPYKKNLMKKSDRFKYKIY